RQRVTDPDVRADAGLHRRTDLQPGGRQDVALVAVTVVDQRDAGRAVRVVLNGSHAAGHARLVALEVDQAQLLGVAAAPVADGDDASVVAAAGPCLGRSQRLLRLVLGDLGEGVTAGAATAGRGGLELLYRHSSIPPRTARSCLQRPA